MESSYLVRFSASREIGRFKTDLSLNLNRGMMVVVQTHRGLEKGEVVGPCFSNHDQFFPHSKSGRILRCFCDSDLELDRSLENQSVALAVRAQTLADELEANLLILDAEILMDQAHAILRFAKTSAISIHSLTQKLGESTGLQFFLEEELPAVEAGCGKDNCGSKSGCNSCSKGSCHSCKSK